MVPNFNSKHVLWAYLLHQVNTIVHFSLAGQSAGTGIFLTYSFKQNVIVHLKNHTFRADVNFSSIAIVLDLLSKSATRTELKLLRLCYIYPYLK